jgi:CDP-diacylglycerol--glycerol-3-phosphate 3-phosphatidyltransferase
MLKINEPGRGDMMRYIAFAIFLFMAVSDGLDGYLARRKKQITSLGSFLDPVADKLLMSCACLLLASQHSGVRGFMLPPTVVVLIIGKDVLLLIGFIVVYFITFKVRIVPVFVGKVATTLQLSMVTGILIGPEISTLIPPWIWVMRFLWWSAAVTAILATLVYIRDGSRYIEQFEQNNVKREAQGVPGPSK